jgi:hypothetical protein
VLVLPLQTELVLEIVLEEEVGQIPLVAAVPAEDEPAGFGDHGRLAGGDGSDWQTHQ